MRCIVYVYVIAWFLADGGETEKEKEQNIAYKNWFIKPNEGAV